MPWKQTTMFKEKQEFIREFQSRKYSIAELCRAFEISRPTAYRLIKKYNQYGEKGLENFSTAPKNHPNKTAPEIETAILYFRNKYKNWGARKIKVLLEMKLLTIMTIMQKDLSVIFLTNTIK